MSPREEVEKRLTELEIKASFADDTLDRLNEVLVRQQQQIDRLQHALEELRAQARGSEPFALGGPRDELPPHY